MKNCYDICLIKSFLVIFIITNLVCLFPSVSVQASHLDSLRVLIRSLQSEIEQKQAVITQLSKEFNTINVRIYKYKAEQNIGVNPFSRLRMQNALKTSHQLADSLESTGRKLRVSTSRLQDAYSAAIQQIEIEIQQELSLMKSNLQDKHQRKNRLTLIRNLENEKVDYAARLQTMKVDEKGWEKILIQSEDTLRRLKLKAALLEDFLTNLRQSYNSLERDINKNLNDQSTYGELLDFYKELDESFDDDQDIFDRNRIEELQDKIENLDGEYGRLKNRMSILGRDILVLRAKIERFRTAINAKEAK